jgi:hypothetical protein
MKAIIHIEAAPKYFIGMPSDPGLSKKEYAAGLLTEEYSWHKRLLTRRRSIGQSKVTSCTAMVLKLWIPATLKNLLVKAQNFLHNKWYRSMTLLNFCERGIYE